MGLFNWFTQDIAIDLGTANTLIIHNDEIVVNEPSIVALDRNNPKNVIAVGKRALMMHEKTHESIRTVRPLKDGVIADFNAAELMIREMIKMIYPKKPLFPPSWRMMICIPSSITEVEKRAVRDSAEQAGAKEVYLLHEPMAAALGIGIDVEERVGGRAAKGVVGRPRRRIASTRMNRGPPGRERSGGDAVEILREDRRREWCSSILREGQRCRTLRGRNVEHELDLRTWHERRSQAVSVR